MTVLSAQSIKANGIIVPLYPKTVYKGKSYGLSAAGYDVRLELGGDRTSHRFMSDSYAYRKGYYRDWCSTFILAATVEHFRMPDNIIGIVHDKSSWARKGLVVQNTVIEPGWRGYLTLELTYHGGDDLIVEQNDPIAQIVFHYLDEPTRYPYEGKYQDQKKGPQPAIDEV